MRLPRSRTSDGLLAAIIAGWPRRHWAASVVDGLRPLGVFTERDVVYGLPEALFTSREQRSRMPLREVMSSPPVTVRRQETLRDAIGRMVDQGLRHLVVVDRHGDLKGLLNSNDLVQFLTDQFPEDTVNLPPRLHQVYHTAEGG